MFASLSANATRFTFKGQSGDFSVYSFTGEEAVNRVFAFSIELVSRSVNVDITALLGTKALLRIADKSGGTRLVHGIIREMEQLHTANRFTHYRCSLVPRLWFLDKIRDHRIFQNLSVVQIIEMILKEQGFDEKVHEFKLFYQYEPVNIASNMARRICISSPDYVRKKASTSILSTVRTGTNCAFATAKADPESRGRMFCAFTPAQGKPRRRPSSAA